MSLEILQKYNIRAKKSLGQNFLVDKNILNQIVDIEEITGKNVLEVGPGYGALTEKLLLKQPKSLHLVELDRDMISILEERQSFGEFEIGNTQFTIFHNDILKFIPEFLDYSVIANIPYYITSPILHHFLYELENTPKTMLILMQKDVGDKIIGGKKNKSSIIKLMIDKKCRATEKIFVPNKSFIPAPKVESSVLLFKTHNIYSDVDDEKFLKIVKQGFCEPRKKLIKNLIKGGFEKEKISEFLCLQGMTENMRAEEGDIEFWIELVRIL